MFILFVKIVLFVVFSGMRKSIHMVDASTVTRQGCEEMPSAAMIWQRCGRTQAISDDKQRTICSVITFRNIWTDLEACITIKPCTRLVNEQMQCSEGTGRRSQRSCIEELKYIWPHAVTPAIAPLSLGHNNTFGSIWRLRAFRSAFYCSTWCIRVLKGFYWLNVLTDGLSSVMNTLKCSGIIICTFEQP